MSRRLLFPWCLVFALALIVFLPHLPHSFLNPERGFWWRYSFRTECLQVLYFSHLVLSVAYCCTGSTYCMRKLLWLCLRKALICEYSGRTLWVMLIFCFFARTVVAGFHLYHSPWSQIVLQKHDNTNSNGIDIKTYVNQCNWIRDTDISPHTYRLMGFYKEARKAL